MAEALVRLELVILDEQLDVGGGQLAPAVRYYRVAITMRLHYWHLKKEDMHIQWGINVTTLPIL